MLIGDVVYLHILGQGVVVLSSHEAASDLLDKRGTIYSDRLSFVMLGELYVFFGPRRFIGLTRDPLIGVAAKTWLVKCFLPAMAYID